MENKKWYMSKTLWTNALAAIAGFIQAQFGYVIDPQIQVYAVLALNFGLRFVTNTAVGK